MEIYVLIAESTQRQGMSQEEPCPNYVILMSMEAEVLEARWAIADDEMGCGSQSEWLNGWAHEILCC